MRENKIKFQNIHLSKKIIAIPNRIPEFSAGRLVRDGVPVGDDSRDEILERIGKPKTPVDDQLVATVFTA